MRVSGKHCNAYWLEKHSADTKEAGFVSATDLGSRDARALPRTRPHRHRPHADNGGQAYDASKRNPVHAPKCDLRAIYPCCR